MDLSIIVPVYNAEEYIEECLDSLVPILDGDVEVIIINDGSTDSSLDISLRYQEGNEKFKVFSYSNGGLSVARNRGVSHSTKKNIMFLDSDDLLQTKNIFRVMSGFESMGLDLLFFSGDVVNEKSELINSQYNYTRSFASCGSVVTGRSAFVEMIDSKNYVVSACMFVLKKKLAEKVLFKEGIYHEDNLFTTKVLLDSSCSRVSFSREVVYLRRVRPGSITTMKVTEAHVLGYIEVYDELNEDRLLIADIELNEKLSVFMSGLLEAASFSLRNSSFLSLARYLQLKYGLIRRRILLGGYSNLSTYISLIKIISPKLVSLLIRLRQQVLGL